MNRCLIVDDSKIVRKTLRLMLEHLGFEASEAENGQTALTHLKMHAASVVLVDSFMPGLTAVETMQAIRADTHVVQPKLICCISNHEATAPDDAMLAVADGYLVKPIDATELAAKLRALGLAK